MNRLRLALMTLPFIVAVIVVVVVVVWERQALSYVSYSNQIETADMITYTLPVRSFTFQFDAQTAVLRIESVINQNVYTITGTQVVGGPENLKRMISWTVAGGTNEVVPPAACQDLKLTYARATRMIVSILCT